MIQNVQTYNPHRFLVDAMVDIIEKIIVNSSNDLGLNIIK